MVHLMRYAKLFPVVLALMVLSLVASPADAQARRGGGGGGRAVPRASAPVIRGGGGRPFVGGGVRVVRPYYGGYYRPYYGYGGYYRPGFSIGIYGGYPFGYGYYGYGYPYYYGGYYGAYGYPAYGYPYGYVGAVSAYGGVRIQGAPEDAQVFADGYYVGVVDDFDGSFQHMNLTPGAHRIEIRPRDQAPVSFDVQVQAGQTITYRADLPHN